MKTRILTRPVVLVAALAVVAMMALAACGSPSPTDADAGSSGSPSASATPSAGGSATTTAKISIQDFSFSPSTATVTAGTTVTWTNDEAAVHDVTSTDGPGTDAATTSTFASETLSQGDSFSFTFETPGTYYYECTIHASMATMHGVVIVE